MTAGKTILVLDDEEAIRETMQLALELRGYEVVAVANGRQGLHALATMNRRPALVLVDVMMPVMDGLSFVDVLGRDPELQGIPVVIVTAFANQASTYRAKAVLTKPISLECLYATVSKYCGEA